MKQNMLKRMGLLLIFSMIFMLGVGCSSKEPVSKTEASEPTASVEDQTAPETTQPEAEQATTAPAEPTTFRVLIPEGATTIAMVKMIHEQPEIAPNVTIDYEALTATDMLAAELMGEKTDFAIVPVNLASKLYNKGIPYKLASINTHGNLYMITSLDISTWDDLKGKDVYMIGQGLIPDLMFRYLAKQNGLDPDKDFNIIYLAGTTEIAPTFLAGKSTITIVPEPVLSVIGTKDVPFTVLFDFQKEFETAMGLEGGYPQAGLMVKNSVAEAYPDVVNAFIDKLNESCTWVNENPDKAGEYVAELDMGIPAPIVVKSMPGLNIRHENAFEHKDSLEALFNILLEASPDSIGGKLPDEGLYFK